MDAPLKDRCIVIIGGTTGLGLSAARACLEAGARVVVVGRDPGHVRAAARELGSSALAMEGDARDPHTAGGAIARAAGELGGFHGLYHVAGGSGRAEGDGPIGEVADEGWAFTLDLNLTSLFYSNRAAVRHFVAAGTGGSIVNMSSVLAFSPSPAHFATHAYAAAKAGAIGLSRAAAAFYAPRDIRFNVIAPGLVATPMARRAAENDDIMRFIETKQPLGGGRIGSPGDLDAAVVFLLSDASRFVTGQVLAVDGGWCVSEGQHAE